MDKLKLAHDWAMKHGSALTHKTVVDSWQYADAMQAEAEKRENKTRPDVLKEEWQPDWSQAPDNADAWRMHGDGNCDWLIDLGGENFKWFGRAPSFNYQGSWQGSLRKRPEALCEVDWRVAPSWAKYWAVRDGSSALWCTSKPTCTDDCLMSHGACGPAPSFDFTGTHIVERPNGF